MKTLLVHYRRWGLALVILLLPLIYHLLSDTISVNKNNSDTFKMQTTSLNPQTILYKADPLMESYFQSAVGSKSNGLTLEKRSENIPEMNKYIWRKFDSHQHINLS
jgi:hypothetical protein